MTATLPPDVRQVFDRFITTEYVTIDAKGQPIAWPVTPYHHAQEGCVDITTGLGYPKKARDAQANPHVALLFSDPNGSGLDAPPMVLVQGTAGVDDQNLESNWLRYERESAEKLPVAASKLPPEFVRRKLMAWYFLRLYVHVRPERVYVWPDADPQTEPQLLDAHMEEVRSGHNEEPEEDPPGPAGGAAMPWDSRLDAIGSRQYPTAVVAIVGPDGFPFAVRLPVTPDRDAGLLRLGADAVGAPLAPGKACVVVHAHDPTSPGSSTSRSAATSSATATRGRSRRARSSVASSSRRGTSP